MSSQVQTTEDTARSLSPVRVLVLSHCFPHPAVPEEAAFVVRDFQALAPAGVEAYVLSPTPYAPRIPLITGRSGRALRHNRTKPEAWTVEGIPVEYPRFPKLPGAIDFGLYGPLYVRAIRKRVQQLHAAHPFDLIHGQWLLPDGYAAAVLGKELGIPAVSNERGYAARCRERRSLLRGTRSAIEGLDRILSVSHSLADCIYEIGSPRSAVDVIYTPIDLEKFAPHDRAAAKKKLALPAGKYIVCTARCEAVKGPELALAAFRQVAGRFPGARFVWLGDGSRLDALRQSAQQMGLQDRVLLPGGIAYEAIPDWLAAADIFLLTSRNEGLPNSLVEAAAAARPIVATQVGGVPEIAIDGETGILAPSGDVKAIARAISALLADERLADRLGQQGRAFVEKHFSKTRFVGDTLAVYQEVLAKK